MGCGASSEAKGGPKAEEKKEATEEADRADAQDVEKGGGSNEAVARSKSTSLVVHDIDEQPSGDDVTALQAFDSASSLGKHLGDEWKDCGNGLWFRGMVINNKPSGWGNARHRNNDTYDGEYGESGKMNGYGRYRFANGDEYRGHWVQGVSDATGIYVFHSYGTYRGEIKHGQMHGFGEFKLMSSTGEYLGHWASGMRDGHGYSITNGCSYEGGWKGGREDGWGVIKDTRSVYYGAWAEGLRHGKGVCLFRGKDGEEDQRYLCDYRKGQRVVLLQESTADAQKLLDTHEWRALLDTAEEEILAAGAREGPTEALQEKARTLLAAIESEEAVFMKRLEVHNQAYESKPKTTSPAEAPVTAITGDESAELQRLREENRRLRAAAADPAPPGDEGEARYRRMYEDTYAELQEVKHKLSAALSEASTAVKKTKGLAIVGKLRAAKDKVLINTAHAFKSTTINASMEAAKKKAEDSNRKIAEMQKQLDLLTSQDNKFVTNTTQDVAAMSGAGMAEMAELRQKLELAEAHAEEFQGDREAKEELERAQAEMKQTIDKLKGQMASESNAVESLQKEMAEQTAQHEKEMKEEKERLSKLLEEHKLEMEQAQEEMEKVRDSGQREAAEREATERERAALAEQMEAIARQKEELEAGYREERLVARKLRNDLEDMKGQIRVYVRTRPMNKVEMSEKGGHKCVEFEDDCTVSLDPDVVGKKGEKKVYQFNRAFDENDGQDSVFAETENLIGSAIDGYNVCIFAYGQTGSGKTWTLTGTPEQPGVARRSITEMFKSVQKVRNRTWDISCYMFEIYNDNVDDLLDTSKKDLKVKKDKKGIVSVAGITEVKCETPEELYAYFEKGLESRKVRGTRMNAASSRMKVTMTNPEDNSSTLGKFTICDLAGSERIAKTQLTDKAAIREATAINQSLSVLGNVISALAQQKEHVPYRDSKLTQVMSDSLGGNAKTLMFVNISPSGYNYDETVSSLNYAARVKMITNNAQKTVETDEIKRLRKQIQQLKAMKGVEALDADGDDELDDI